MRKSEALLSLALLGSASASCWLWAELRAERGRSAELTARIEASKPVLMTPAEPLATTRDEPSAVTTSTAPTATLVVADPPANPATVPEEDSVAKEMRLMRDPRYREAWRQEQRVQMALRRENLIRLLGFTPQQADAVIEVSIDRHLKWFDHESPDPMTPEDLQRQNEWDAANERADQAKLRELLGEARRAQLQTYMESRGARATIDRFRTQLPASDALRDDQVEALITALHVEHSPMRQQLEEYSSTLDWERDAVNSLQEFATRQNQLMKEADERVHDTAAPILSRSQLQQIDAMLLRDRQKLESEQRLSRLQRKLDSPAGVAATR